MCMSLQQLQARQAVTQQVLLPLTLPVVLLVLLLRMVMAVLHGPSHLQRVELMLLATQRLAD